MSTPHSQRRPSPAAAAQQDPAAATQQHPGEAAAQRRLAAAATPRSTTSGADRLADPVTDTAPRAHPGGVPSPPGGAGAAARHGRGAAAGERLAELDVLRAVALVGILFVNIPPVMRMSGVVDGELLPARHLLDLLVQQRFFPIFSVLFGVGFGIFLRRSAARAAHPRVLLLRRLLVLGVFGALHQLLQPGEALLPYAVVGLVVLLPLSFAPPRANLLVGSVLLVLAVVLGGGIALIPGLLLIGAALGRGEVVRVLRCDVRVLLAVAAASAALAVGTGFWQEQDPLSAGFTVSSGVAGLCTAAVYVTGTLLVLRTPAGGAVTRVCAPAGRMALTNYVTATLLFIPFGHLLGLHGSDRWGLMAALGAAILTVQFGWSLLWLRHFRYGPLEWVWRCLTWWQVVPLRNAERAEVPQPVASSAA